MIEDLLTLDQGSIYQNGCHVFDMKEWLTAVVDGDRMPSKNEFDMDYEEFLRDKLKNKEITEEQKKSLLKSPETEAAF